MFTAAAYPTPPSPAAIEAVLRPCNTIAPTGEAACVRGAWVVHHGNATESGGACEAFALLDSVPDLGAVEANGWPVCLVTQASPWGRALTGKRIGDTITVPLPGGEVAQAQIVWAGGMGPVLSPAEATRYADEERQAEQAALQAQAEQARAAADAHTSALAHAQTASHADAQTQLDAVRRMKAARKAREMANKLDEKARWANWNQER